MHPRKFRKVIRTSEAVIEAFMNHEGGLDLLARYYWLKVNFISSFMHYNSERAAQRLRVSRHTVERAVRMLLEHGLAWADGKGYRLLSKRQLDQSFVPVLQQKRLLHSCTLCIKDGAKSKRKYGNLLDKLATAGLIDRDTLSNTSKNAEVEVLYIQPNHGPADYDSISFDEIATQLKQVKDGIAPRFAKSLLKWKENPN